jgi:rod shape-determining protein MreD
MSSDLWWPNLSRFVLIVLAQGLLFIELPKLTDEYVQIFLYPVIIMLLPLDLAVPTLVVAGFVIGFSVDMFYASYGVHAAASTFSAFTRRYILAAYEPRAGFGKAPIANVNLSWFMKFAAIFFACHLLYYFSIEAFSLVYVGRIAAQSIVAWVLSLMSVFAFILIFDPKK